MALDWATMPIPKAGTTAAVPAVNNAQAISSWATMPVGGGSFVDSATPQQLAALTPAQHDFLASQIKEEGEQPVTPPSPHGLKQRAVNLGIGALQGVADLGNLIRSGISAGASYDPRHAAFLSDLSGALNSLSGSTPEAEEAKYSQIYGGLPAAMVGRFVGNAAATAPFALASGGAVGGLLPEASSGLGALARLSLISGTEGATYGGLTNPGPGGNRLVNAAEGAGTGLLMPGALAVGGKALSALGRGAGMLTKAGKTRLAQQSVGDMLSELGETGAGEATPQAPPLPGMQQTLGQSTGNPSYLALEKGAFDTPAGAAKYAELRNANNAIVQKAVSGMAQNVQPEATDELAGNMSRILQDSEQAVRGNASKLWNAVDPEGKAFFRKQDLVKAVQDARANMGAANNALVPNDIDNIIQSEPDKIPIMEMARLRSAIAGVARNARVQSSPSEYPATQIGSAIRGVMKSPQLVDADGNGLGDEAQAVLDRYNTANDYAQSMHDVFDSGRLSPLFRELGSGSLKTTPIQAARKILAPSEPENIDEATKAFALGGQPQAGTVAMQNSLISQWLKAGAMKGQFDRDGNQILSGSNLDNFYKNNAPVFKKLFPTKTQNALLQKIRSAALSNDRIQNTIGTGGSPTALKVQAQQLINDLMGHVYAPSPFETGVEGALIGQAVDRGGEALPWYMGGRAIGYARGRMLRALRPYRETVLLDALRNPETGLKLMQQANERNAQKLLPRYSKLLLPANAIVQAAEPR